MASVYGCSFCNIFLRGRQSGAIAIKSTFYFRFLGYLIQCCIIGVRRGIAEVRQYVEGIARVQTRPELDVYLRF
jgi:hypothetical protein